MTRDEAERQLQAHLEDLCQQGETVPAITHFDCGELGTVSVYRHPDTWWYWFRWLDIVPAPWLCA